MIVDFQITYTAKCNIDDAFVDYNAYMEWHPDCDPNEAIMIGDRLDNDIIPAKKLGMKTIWVRQVYAVYQKIDDECKKPDHIVDSIEELPALFERERI